MSSPPLQYRDTFLHAILLQARRATNLPVSNAQAMVIGDPKKLSVEQLVNGVAELGRLIQRGAQMSLFKDKSFVPQLVRKSNSALVELRRRNAPEFNTALSGFVTCIIAAGYCEIMQRRSA